MQTMNNLGWKPGRQVSHEELARWTTSLAQTDGFELSDAARRVLSGFGGLRFQKRTREGIDFSPLSFDLNPLLATGERDRIIAYEESLGHPLYPLGEVEGGHAFIVMDDEGAVYLIMDKCTKVADDIYMALQSLIEGRRMDLERGKIA